MRIIQGVFSSRKSDAGFFQLYSVSPTPNKNGKFVVKNKYGESVKTFDNMSKAKKFVDDHNLKVHGRVGATSLGIAGGALGGPVGALAGGLAGYGAGKLAGEFRKSSQENKFNSGKNKYYGQKNP